MVQNKIETKRCLASRWMPCLILLFATMPNAIFASSGTLIPESTRYPRLVRLTHGSAASNGWIVASTISKLFVSKDDGKTFSFLSNAPSRSGVKLRCCETLFELPRALGSLPAGTLLYAATYVDEAATKSSSGSVPSPTFPGVFAIDVYASDDQGQHWTYLSTPVSGSGERGAGGLWEPEFLVAHNGSLVMFWSDETYSCCSQKLMKIRSSNGKDWRNPSDVVATTNPKDRPGMIVIRQLPTGVYFMVYEMCGTHHCDAFFRKSYDGWSFGLPSDIGTRIENDEGQYLRHAPTVIWTPSPLSPNGMIVAFGQMLYNADGSLAKQNGRVLFVNTHLDGSGGWHTIKAPVEVPNTYNHPCPNYSSSLLPVRNGEALLELATDFYALDQCGASFGTRSWTDLLPADLVQSLSPISH